MGVALTVRGPALGGLVAVVACTSNGAPPAPAPKPEAHALPVDGVAPGAAPSAPSAPRCPAAVRSLGPGITHQRVPIAGQPAIASVDDCLDVVRVDLGGHQLRALTAARDGGARPLPRWLADEDLIGGINAGMFHATLRSVGMLVTSDGANNPADNRAFGGFLAFDPFDPASPPAIVAGRVCAGFDLAALRARYRSIAQSYRLVGCDGEAIPWQDDKAYSAAAIGVDRAGRIVLLHARAPHRMRDLSTTAAGLDLAGAIFVEGGPEASLIVHGRDGSVERVGSYETGFVENDANVAFWALPNIIGIARVAP